MSLLTRRDLLSQAAKVFAGGIVAASGILAIVPKAATRHKVGEVIWGIVDGMRIDGCDVYADACQNAAQAVEEYTFTVERFEVPSRPPELGRASNCPFEIHAVYGNCGTGELIGRREVG